jgi:hypothetical protein
MELRFQVPSPFEGEGQEGGDDGGRNICRAHAIPILAFPLEGGRENRKVTPYLAVAFL